MPGGDGTGPGGRGAGTGWGTGPCGGGRYSRRQMGTIGQPQQASPEEELKMLKEEKVYVDKRITELGKEKKKK